MAEKDNMADTQSFEWDDTAILQAYDKCTSIKFKNMKNLEKQLQDEKKKKKAELQMAEGSSQTPMEIEGDATKKEFPKLDEEQKVRKGVSPKSKENKTSMNATKKAHKNFNSETSTFAAQNGHNFHSTVVPGLQWKVGGHCRAIYSVDGKEYEATIRKVDYKKGTCVVRYCGYEYEEEVALDSLLPSEGKSSWQKQRHTEFRSQRDNHDCKCSSQLKPMSRGLPPPPPPFVLSNLPSDEGDALSAMLMSWYMSGFHTGYYQGLLRSRDNNH